MKFKLLASWLSLAKFTWQASDSSQNALGLLNSHLSFPFLSYVEQSSQNDLVMILLKLYSYLLKSKTGTLEKFEVDIQGFSKSKLLTDTGKETIKLCVSSVGENMDSQTIHNIVMIYLTWQQLKEFIFQQIISSMDVISRNLISSLWYHVVQIRVYCKKHP